MINMKTTNFLTVMLFAGVVCACSRKETPANPPTEPVVKEDHTKVDSIIPDLNAEWNDYRTRIKNRIDTIETNLAEKRELRKAERDVKKKKAYDTYIEEREKLKDEFKRDLDDFESRTKTGWEKFKADLDDLFNRDEKWTKSDVEHEKKREREQEKEREKK
jgi:hypothetical protein